MSLLKEERSYLAIRRSRVTKEEESPEFIS